MSKTRCSEQLSLFSVGEQEVTVDFAGGQIVTDAGLLAVAQLVEGLGILDDLADRWPDPRCQAMVTHTGRELLALQIYQYLAGYFDFNDANFTRHDPLFQALAGVSPSAGRPLASGSPLGRFLHTYTRREAHKPVEERDVIFEQRHAQIQRIRLLNEYLVELFAKTRPRAPTHVILDLDGTADAAHGQQQLTFWNMHYDQNQYFPLHLFDAVTGFPLAAWLRPGNVHDSLGAVETLQSVVEPLRRCFPGLTIFVRGDGAFGTPEMLDYCEHGGLLYAFGYSNHQGLKPRTAWFSDLSGLCDAGRSTAQASPTPVVTVGRNEAVPVARVAVVRVPVNAIGVLQASQLEPRTSLREVVRWEVATLRNQLFKVGALVKASVRRIWFHFSSHWPRQELFCRICQAVSDYVERYRQRYLLPTGPPG